MTAKGLSPYGKIRWHRIIDGDYMHVEVDLNTTGQNPKVYYVLVSLHVREGRIYSFIGLHYYERPNQSGDK